MYYFLPSSLGNAAPLAAAGHLRSLAPSPRFLGAPRRPAHAPAARPGGASGPQGDAPSPTRHVPSTAADRPTCPRGVRPPGRSPQGRRNESADRAARSPPCPAACPAARRTRGDADTGPPAGTCGAGSPAPGPGGARPLVAGGRTRSAGAGAPARPGSRAPREPRAGAAEHQGGQGRGARRVRRGAASTRTERPNPSPPARERSQRASRGRGEPPARAALSGRRGEGAVPGRAPSPAPPRPLTWQSAPKTPAGQAQL